jgi:cobalamin biosynthesis Mg chelatase CobN
MSTAQIVLAQAVAELCLLSHAPVDSIFVDSSPHAAAAQREDGLLVSAVSGSVSAPDTARPPAERTMLDLLPERVLRTVMSHLSPADVLLRVAPACRRLCRIAHSDHLWRTLLKRDFPQSSTSWSVSSSASSSSADSSSSSSVSNVTERAHSPAPFASGASSSSASTSAPASTPSYASTSSSTSSSSSVEYESEHGDESTNAEVLPSFAALSLSMDTYRRLHMVRREQDGGTVKPRPRPDVQPHLTEELLALSGVLSVTELVHSLQYAVDLASAISLNDPALISLYVVGVCVCVCVCVLFIYFLVCLSWICMQRETRDR